MSNCLNSPCDPCTEECVDDVNPCYENCGCLNPTTFECITIPGTGLINIPITNNMNGLQVLSAIDSAIGAIKQDIQEIEVPISNSADIYSKVSATDTATGYLNSKIAAGNHIAKFILNSGGNEQLRISVTPNTLISSDEGNLISLGADGKLKVIASTSATDVNIVAGSGVTVSGDGSDSDPFIISTNPSIQAARACFNGTWQNLIIGADPSGMTKLSGQPQYRIRHDGSIEFKGSLTYTVAFGSYSAGPRKITGSVSSIPSTCLTLVEQNGVADLKSVNYVDIPGADNFVQQYGYIIRKSSNAIVLEFQGVYAVATNKTITVNFDGAISHPNI